MFMLASWPGHSWRRDFHLNETFTWSNKRINNYFQGKSFAYAQNVLHSLMFSRISAWYAQIIFYTIFFYSKKKVLFYLPNKESTFFGCTVSCLGICTRTDSNWSVSRKCPITTNKGNTTQTLEAGKTQKMSQQFSILGRISEKNIKNTHTCLAV